MQVVKRDGSKVPVSFDSVTARISPLCDGLWEKIDPTSITKKVVEGIFDGVPTWKIDELAAETCAYMSQTHPDYSLLAARIAATNLQKNSSPTFSECVEKLCATVDSNGDAAPLVNKEILEVTRANKDQLNAAVKPERDLDFDYFGSEMFAIRNA